jgi:hypothetical protein
VNFVCTVVYRWLYVGWACREGMLPSCAEVFGVREPAVVADAPQMDIVHPSRSALEEVRGARQQKVEGHVRKPDKYGIIANARLESRLSRTFVTYLDREIVETMAQANVRFLR